MFDPDSIYADPELYQLFTKQPKNDTESMALAVSLRNKLIYDDLEGVIYSIYDEKNPAHRRGPVGTIRGTPVTNKRLPACLQGHKGRWFTFGTGMNIFGLPADKLACYLTYKRWPFYVGRRPGTSDMRLCNLHPIDTDTVYREVENDRDFWLNVWAEKPDVKPGSRLDKKDLGRPACVASLERAVIYCPREGCFYLQSHTPGQTVGWLYGIPTTGVKKALHLKSNRRGLVIRAGISGNCQTVSAAALAWYLTYGEWPYKVGYRENIEDLRLDNIYGLTKEQYAKARKDPMFWTKLWKNRKPAKDPECQIKWATPEDFI